MATCKYCQTEITWQKVAGKNTPYNIDGTLHRCKNGSPSATSGQEKSEIITGMLTSYTSGSATFRLKSGMKTYVITSGMAQEWREAGFLLPPENHPEVWLEFSVDKNMFVQLNYKTVQKPAWGVVNPAQHPETPLTPPPAEQKTAMEKPAEPPCTSPAGTPHEPRKKGPVEEDRMPTREELLAMVYDYNTYWKAKTIMDLQAHDEIRRQVEWKNWQEAVGLAIAYQQARPVESETVFESAAKIHKFITEKTGGVV